MTEHPNPAVAPWRRTALTVTAIALCSTISAMVAYRLGLRKTTPPAITGPAAASLPGCNSYTEANGLVGQESCITGRVLKVYTSKSGNTYFDFCEDYRACPFSSVIFTEDRIKFGDLMSLQGRHVEIRGLVSYYKDRPQIIVRAPEQLKLRESVE